MHLCTNMRLLAQRETMTLEEFEAAQSFSNWLLDVSDGSPTISDKDGIINVPESTPLPFCFTR